MFGFFVNGQNVALIPGTNLPVSINNVNGGMNPLFYINNEFSPALAPVDTEMDGLTTVLTAQVQVNPDVTNHIKLAIADAGDDAVDSNVFIKAGSLSSSAVSLTPATLGFANQVVNTSSAAKQVSVVNTGSAVVTIGTITASVGFSETHNCPAQLAPAGQPGSTCTINVTFNPPSAGSFSGAVTLNDDSPRAGSQQSISVSGVGVAPTLQFADIAVTAAGAPSPVGGQLAFSATVKNNGPANATNVVLTDVLDNFGFVSPASSTQGFFPSASSKGVVPSAASSTQGSCTYSAPVVTCNLGPLANGASAVVTVVVTPPSAGWAANTFHASADQPDQDPTNNSVRLGPSLDTFNTPVGSNVTINASDPADNLIASLTFSNVTRTGSTTMNPLSAASLPAGFRSGRQPTFFDISTNAEFVGAIGLNIHFLPANFRHPALVRLFHFEGGTWVDRTTGLNVSSGVIAGQVMSLSPFALLEPVDTIPVARLKRRPLMLSRDRTISRPGRQSTRPGGDEARCREPFGAWSRLVPSRAS